MAGPQRHRHDFQYLHPPGLQLKNSFSRSHYGRISDREEINVPPMSLLAYAKIECRNLCSIYRKLDFYVTGWKNRKSPETPILLGFPGFGMWCRWPDSNRHGVLAQRILSPSRLPIPSHRHPYFQSPTPDPFSGKRRDIVEGHENQTTYSLFIFPSVF